MEKIFDINEVRKNVAEALKIYPLPNTEIARNFEKIILLDPVEGEVELEAYRAPHIGLPVGFRTVWFIAKDCPQSVFFDPLTGLFGACWGPDAKTGAYVDLGFQGRDPFEMYQA